MLQWKKKMKKFWIIFGIEDWLWKSSFGTFETSLMSLLTQFSKFNNFLWVWWFLGKYLSNFVPPVWKLHYLYCHNLQCCPVSVPHRLATPGMVVLGLVIVSSSLAVPQSPSVSGPARTAVSKSNLWSLRIKNGLKSQIWEQVSGPEISYYEK